MHLIGVRYELTISKTKCDNFHKDCQFELHHVNREPCVILRLKM